MALNAVCNERLQSRELLLQELVKVVGFLIDISCSRQSVFALWSGVNHLHSCVKAIVRHGAKIRHHLIYAQPSFAAFDSWLEARLVDFSLAEELVTCRKDIFEFYYEWSFFQNTKLFHTFIECLNVLATRDLEALLKIETITREIVAASKERRKEKMNKIIEADGSIGTEHVMMNPQENASSNDLPEMLQAVAVKSPKIDTDNVVVSDEASVSHSTPKPQAHLHIPSFTYASVSPICSPPEFSQVMGLEIKTSTSTPELSTASSSTSHKIKILEHASPPKIVHASPTKLPSIFPEDFLERSKSFNLITIHPEDSGFEQTRKPTTSFLESGGFIQPAALGNFPLPQQGQSLTSFLSSLSDTNSMPELDRENAHFNVSEALISAFERLRVSKISHRISEITITPDEMEDMFGTVEPAAPIANRPLDHPDPKSGSSRKYYSGRKFPRPPILHTETEESEAEYWKQQPRRPPSHLRKKPRTGKLGSDGQSTSFLSTTEISSSSSPSCTELEEDIVLSSFSAEHVALNLLRNARMRDEHLPPASELKWFVSETQAPQALLPLPKTLTPSASEGEISDGKTDGLSQFDRALRLRGTCDWAPPRPQIIFTIHPPPSLRILTDLQKYRCAGCGMRVDPKYASTFRYCFYLGRYFCTGCHIGKKARLPQLILHKWDFSPYLVSNFSATLLESLQADPVYNALAVNPGLTKKPKLNNFRNYRIQLALLNEYLKNCKTAEPLYRDYLKFPTYYTADVDLCSLEDLINVRFSTGLPMILKDFVQQAIHHVMHCELCRNVGFVCELCSRKEVIFPFQINRVSRCNKCASCFHLKCYNPNISNCPKCIRISRRRDLEVSPATIAV